MTIEDIKKLANMARIDMSEEEMAGIAKDFDPILAYVSQIQEASKLAVSLDRKEENIHNIMREDIATHKTGEYTESILADAPDTENGFLKVKQIL